MCIDTNNPAVRKRYKSGDIVTIVPRSFVLEQTPAYNRGFDFPCFRIGLFYFNRKMLQFCGMRYRLRSIPDLDWYDVKKVGNSLENCYAWCSAMFMESYTEEEQREMLAKEEAYRRDENRRLEQEPL